MTLKEVLGDEFLGDEITQQICEILVRENGEFVSELKIAIELQVSLFPLRKRFEKLRKVQLIKGENYSWQALPNLIYAVGSEQDSHLQEHNSDSSYSDSAKSIHSAEKSSPNDSQTATTTETFAKSQVSIWDTISRSREELISSRQAHRANPSQSKESGLVQKTRETASPQSRRRSEKSSRNSSASKTCRDSSPANLNQEAPTHISDICSQPLTRVGTMRNGSLSAQDTLAPPSLEKGYFWLESPSALSSTGKGRPPGSTKLEAQLKNLQLLQKGECLNPDWLEKHYHLPPGWTSPQESRAATELLADAEKLWEMPLIQELHQLPSSESFISQKSIAGEHLNGSAWSHPLEPKRQPSGTIYPYTKPKTLKSGERRLYPKVDGVRNPENLRHWFWHYCYEEKGERGWRCRKVQVPPSKVLAVRSLIASNKPIQEILQFINTGKREKKKREV